MSRKSEELESLNEVESEPELKHELESELDLRDRLDLLDLAMFATREQKKIRGYLDRKNLDGALITPPFFVLPPFFWPFGPSYLLLLSAGLQCYTQLMSNDFKIQLVSFRYRNVNLIII